MTKYLIIVESPSKCQKVEKAAGANYKCVSSCGHIYELEKGIQAIDIENGFEPKYRLMSSKRTNMSKIKQIKKNYETIYLAGDPDREGEVISYHLAQELKILKTAKRISFNEISKSAIKNALANPRKIDMNLCDAQKARRVLDRLMGFELSPLLWNYIPNSKSLSAGRCQSPALNLIIKREKDINEFQAENYFKLDGKLNYKSINQLKVSFSKSKISTQEIGVSILEDCLKSKFIVDKIEHKNTKSSPSAPFTTSSLQQEASQKLGMSPKTTMMVAQKLYEKGLITYMRTDSTTLSNDAKKAIKNKVKQLYTNDYYQSRDYKSKIMNAQEAHECIRIVDLDKNLESIDLGNEKKLYDLIYKRTLGCQMKDQIILNQYIYIKAISQNKTHVFVCHEETTTFPGYSIIYDNQNKELTKIKVGDELSLNLLELEENKTKSKSRFTEASLVKELEKSGIGRPSTFSNIVTTLFDRGYIQKGTGKKIKINKMIHYIKYDTDKVLIKNIEKTEGNDKGKILVTELGTRVINFLDEHFRNLLDAKLTSLIETDLDKIANGLINWTDIVSKFYQSFHPKVLTLSVKPNETKILNSSSFLHLFGNKKGYEYGIIKNKYGDSFVRKSINNEIKYLPIVKKIYNNPKTLTLEQIIYMFSLPKTFYNQYQLNYGKNGYYIVLGNTSITLEGDYSKNNIPKSEELSLMFKKRNGNSIGEDSKYYYNIVDTKYGKSFIRKPKNKKGKVKFLAIVNSLYGDGGDIELNKLKFMFTLPKTYHKIYTLCYGMNGYYLKKDKQSVSLDGDYSDGLDLTLDEIEKMFSSENSSKSKILKKINDYVIMEGKYGPFLLYKKKVYKIPDDIKIEAINKTLCEKIIKA